MNRALVDRSWPTLAAVIACVSLSAGAMLRPQPTASPATAPEPSGQEDAADLPGAQHAALATLAGDWNTSTTLTVDGAEAGPAETGTARIESILDLRFIAIHESGNMLGQPMAALKLVGFNNASGLFEATWVYTGSTATMRARGVRDPDTGVITFQAQYASGPDENERFIITLATAQPEADAGAQPHRFTISLVALMSDGAAGPTLTTVYTRSP